MWAFAAIVTILWVGLIVWLRRDLKTRKKESEKKKYKPPFRTEEDLEEYAKPMDDKHEPHVDFDDAE